ncbi:MAG: hypothetical protein R6X10_05550 [Desulfobacterales bacterium]
MNIFEPGTHTLPVSICLPVSRNAGLQKGVETMKASGNSVRIRPN